MNLQFKWKRVTGRYGTGERLYLNKIRVGFYEWNVSRSQKDTTAPIWSGSINLPSLNKTIRVVYDNDEAAIKAKIEKVITSWFIEALKEGE